MVTSLRSWFPSTSLYVDFRPPPLTKSGFSGVARMKRSAIRERFRSWPLEECADLGTSPFMVPFDKPVLSRVEGLRTGSGSPRTVLLGSSPQTGGSTGSSRTVLLGSSPQTGGSTSSPRTVLLGSSPQTGGSTGTPRTEFSAQSSLTGNMESHHERTLLSLHCRGHATRSSLRPGCGAGKHTGAGA